jgi:hypothetical protein
VGAIPVAVAPPVAGTPVEVEASPPVAARHTLAAVAAVPLLAVAPVADTTDPPSHCSCRIIIAPLQAAGKSLQAVIPSPFAVILSGAKDLRVSLRVNSARNLALSVFNAVRDSSSSANENGGLLGMTGQTGFSAACLAQMTTGVAACERLLLTASRLGFALSPLQGLSPPAWPPCPAAIQSPPTRFPPPLHY